MKSRVKTRNIFTMFVFMCFLFLSILPGDAATPPIWQVELCQNLNSLKSGNFLHQDIQDLHTLASVYSDSEVAMKAILEIFVEGIQEIDLFWWKSENRPVRCFILALKVQYNDEYWLAESKSSIKRFREPEQQERNEELAFVLEYRSALAEAIAEILRKRDFDNSSIEFFQGVADRNLGKRLPNWCRDAKK